MCSFVGDDGVEFTIAECGLVYREMCPDVLGVEYPFFGMFFLIPCMKVGEVVFVLFFKFFRVNIVGYRYRRE